MTTWLKLAAAVVTLILAVSVFFAWRGAQQQQLALQAELKSTQQALSDATAREATRDATVSTLIAQLKKDKAAVQTPAQLIQSLPEVLPLPLPIIAAPAQQASDEKPNNGQPGTPSANPIPTKLDFPAADLKPLYDFALDCKSCQAQLTAALADLKDEKAKEQALSRERDAALRAAKGGSLLRRVARAAKWFAIGAVAGAIAARAAH
jgi:hypothetical protein